MANFAKWFTVFWGVIAIAVSALWMWPLYMIILAAILVFLPIYLIFKIIHWFALAIVWIVSLPFKR